MNHLGWIKSESEIRTFAKENDDISNEGCYINLMLQLNRLAKHAKGVSRFKTLPQYYHHVDLFCRFLADYHNIKSLANIKNKHLVNFVLERQSEGKSAATIKNDLAAIRYFHDQLAYAKHQLSNNHTLAEQYVNFNLERRTFGGIDRRPTNVEYQGLLAIAEKANRHDISLMLKLARLQGLRVHEITRLSRSDAEKAIRENKLTVKGKGGLVRSVPLHSSILEDFKCLLPSIPRGNKLFVPENRKAHHVIQQLQDFVRYYRTQVYDVFNTRPEGIEVTMHSFRHAYAKQYYDTLITLDVSEIEARVIVSKLIGHNREDVTRIYLSEG